QFLHTCGGQANCRPDDAANCPPGGCILEIADANRAGDNGEQYRFCNGTDLLHGQNGCTQTGDLISTASLVLPSTGYPPSGGECSNNATQSCTTDTNCGTGNYCYTQTNSCVPGDCPSCRVNNITVRYNDFYNVINGVQIGTEVSSHCRDEASGA